MSNRTIWRLGAVGVFALLTITAVNLSAEELCQIELNPANHDRVSFHWLLAKRGTERTFDTVWQVVGAPVTCASLGVDADDYATARWLSIIRFDPEAETTEDRYQFERLAPTGPVCNLDITGDGKINEEEWAHLNMQFINPKNNTDKLSWKLMSGDFNGDGFVNFLDFALLAEFWGQTCTG